jgi:hypothetical protein
MQYLRNKIFIWIGNYFPFVLRFFELKVLRFGYIDITPDLCSGSRPNKKMVESKVSWLIENLSEYPLPVKIVISCVQSGDGWVQIYPVNQALQGGSNRDISYGEEKFDLESRQKCKKTWVPIEGFLKVDHFASQQPHPSWSSNLAFQIVPEDNNVILIQRDFLNQKSARIVRLLSQSLLCICGLFLAAFLIGYFWVQFGNPVWEYFFY